MAETTHHQGPIASEIGKRDLVAGDFVASAGLGATATVVPAAKSKDLNGKIVITSAGAGQGANPTVTLTFAEAFATAPIVVVSRGNETGDDQLAIPVIAKVTATGIVFTFVGTPVAADTYTVYWRGAPVE